MENAVKVPSVGRNCRAKARKYALIVDDSRAQRLVFARHLNAWGYETVEAGSGEEALTLCRSRHFDLVLSDWMMPGMSGPEFCREFRACPQDSYSYFILLTSKNDKSAVAAGLNVGADDFLSKPVSTVELHARIKAGERLLAMEREVKKANHELRHTLDELQQVYDALERDLRQARNLQHILIGERQRDFGNCKVAFLLQSSGHVGGDLVGAFRIDAGRIGVYSIDVAGHGVAAAMLSARISALFAAGADSQNVVIGRDPVTGERTVLRPEQVAARMNQMMLEEMDTEAYLTMAYADIDLTTGRAQIVQAGHPHPVVQRAGGNVEFLGEGGLPVGLIAQAEYCSFEITLSPGDRLFLYSDGITECTNARTDEFGQTRLGELLKRLQATNGCAFLDALKWELGQWAGKDEFADDVSAAVIEFAGIQTP